MKRSQLIGIVVALVLVDGTLLCIHAPRAREGVGTWHVPTAQGRVASVFAALEQEGLRALHDALERAAAEDSAVLRDGHQLAHALGRQALDRARGERSRRRATRSAWKDSPPASHSARPLVRLGRARSLPRRGDAGWC